jgi:hypothetical protein
MDGGEREAGTANKPFIPNELIRQVFAKKLEKNAENPAA